MVPSAEQFDDKNLKDYYKYVYKCKTCGQRYGSDEKEHLILCPPCYNTYIKNRKANK